jgi:hypothetical protein
MVISVNPVPKTQSTTGLGSEVSNGWGAGLPRHRGVIRKRKNKPIRVVSFNGKDRRWVFRQLALHCAIIQVKKSPRGLRQWAFRALPK